jgi:hypothetical protein
MKNIQKQPESGGVQATKRPDGGTNYKAEGIALLGLKVSASATHEAHWDSKSYAILFGLLSALWAVAGYGTSELLPLCPGLKVAVLVAVFVIVGFIIWWQRYRILMTIRWLDRKFTARKTFRSK